jgi:hypothetical protein
MILCRVTYPRGVRRIVHLMKNQLVGFAILLLAGSGLGAVPQAPAPGELAARMTGRWKLNRELSPDLAKPGPGRGRRGGGPSFAMAPAVSQRGGRGDSGASEPRAEMPAVTAAEAAAQAALAAIQEVPPELTIDATPAVMTLTEPRGPSTFQIDGKDAKVEVPGGVIKVKSKWDRTSLRQDFSSAMRKVTRSWSVDASGRLVLNQRVEGISLKRTDIQAFFDRQ